MSSAKTAEFEATTGSESVEQAVWHFPGAGRRQYSEADVA